MSGAIRASARIVTDMVVGSSAWLGLFSEFIAKDRVDKKRREKPIKNSILQPISTSHGLKIEQLSTCRLYGPQNATLEIR